MFRKVAFLTGATAFFAAHLLEVLAWRLVFEPSGEHTPWFLNSGRAVAFTAACIFLVSFAYVRMNKRTRSSWTPDAGTIIAGAVVALTVVLAAVGPGTIFPIAWVVGAVIVAGASIAGALTGTKL